MGGVTVDPDELRESAGGFAVAATFCGGPAASGSLSRPTAGRIDLERQLAGLSLGATLKNLDTNWSLKCQSLAEELSILHHRILAQADLCPPVGHTDPADAEGSPQ